MNSAEKQMRKKLISSLVVGILVSISLFAAWKWLRTSGDGEGIPAAFRRVFEWNEKISRKVYSPDRLAPSFPKQAAVAKPRVNGDLGLKSKLDLKKWRLHIVADQKELDLTLDDLKKLPFVEQTTEFKCIEGWSEIVNYGGFRLKDLLDAYAITPYKSSDMPQILSSTDSLSLETTDKEYFVGIDLPTAYHPQTLLAYKLNGEDLPLEHGAPLRLITPLKYGIKNIKRVGSISFYRGRAPDYWAQFGYDWYSGH